MSRLFLSGNFQELRNVEQLLCFFCFCWVLYQLYLTEKRKVRHLKLWAPPTWMHGWPQMKPAGKYNPHRNRLAALWTHRDAQVWWRPAANERGALFFFFVNRSLPACRLLSVHLPALRDLWHTRGLRSLTPLNNAGRIRPLPVFISPSVSLALFSRYKSQPLMPKPSSRVPVHLLDKCEQNVNCFQSTHIQTPSQ